MLNVRHKKTSGTHVLWTYNHLTVINKEGGVQSGNSPVPLIYIFFGFQTLTWKYIDIKLFNFILIVTDERVHNMQLLLNEVVFNSDLVWNKQDLSVTKYCCHSENKRT